VLLRTQVVSTTKQVKLQPGKTRSQNLNDGQKKHWTTGQQLDQKQYSHLDVLMGDPQVLDTSHNREELERKVHTKFAKKPVKSGPIHTKI
jgi:hypothetical protein